MYDFWTEMWLRLPVTVVLGAASGAASFAIYMWLNYRLHLWIRNRLQTDLAKYAKKHGAKEIALVLSVREDIMNSVQSHLEKDDRGEIQVFQVHQQEGFNDEEERWIAYLEKIKTEIRKIRELGIQRMFIFSNLPIAMALVAGATLQNGPEAVIHHYSGGSYLPVVRLTPETIRL